MDRMGIATWAIDGESLSSKLRILANIGYDAACVLGNFLNEIPADDLASVERILHERDMVITVHSNFGRPKGEVDEKACLAQAERILEWHKRTGRVECLSYDAPWKEITKGVFRIDPTSILGVFEKVLDLTPESGMRVALEDCPLDDDEAVPFADWEKYPHWGILVDLGHMNMRLREPKHDVQPLKPGAVEEFLRGIPAPILELHVHSNDGSEDDHLPPYMGNADLATAAHTLKQIGFSGVSTIEFGRAWCNSDAEQILHAARESMGYWSKLMSSSTA
jgi:sugar phosphate isomerase/epimerase